MPLIYRHQINEATKIGVWHITEGEDFFLKNVTLQRDITHPHKRLQHLAGRHLLRELFPDFPLQLIEIADTRKPFLADEAFHFSISHCGEYAAVIVSTQNRAGVDIEIPHAKIERIQHKFLSDKELGIIAGIHSARHEMITTAWSIKEAIFKWYGEGQVDFIKHIEIRSVTPLAGRIKAECIFKKEGVTSLEVQSVLLRGNNLSWLIT